MFGSNVATSGLTFGKVLTGISKTLSIANQVIPLYQQAKPMINNAKTILTAIKGIKFDNPKNSEITKELTIKSNTNGNIEKAKTNNNPVFFQ